MWAQAYSRAYSDALEVLHVEGQAWQDTGIIWTLCWEILRTSRWDRHSPFVFFHLLFNPRVISTMCHFPDLVKMSCILLLVFKFDVQIISKWEDSNFRKHRRARNPQVECLNARKLNCWMTGTRLNRWQYDGHFRTSQTQLVRISSALLDVCSSASAVELNCALSWRLILAC